MHEAPAGGDWAVGYLCIWTGSSDGKGSSQGKQLKPQLTIVFMKIKQITFQVAKSRSDLR